MRPQTRELIGSAGTIRLKPRPMDVLVNLAEHAGQLRTREEVLADVWGDIAISEEVLTHCIWELRNALGDDRREPRFIETLHRSGYRLIAPVIPVDDDAGPLEVIPATEDERELASLRGRVQRFWIEQVLDRSLSQSEILTIDAEERPELVRHPWAGVRPPPLAASPRAVIPPGENILATFDRMGAALLIVGTAGAGKTVTLLQLARLALERARREGAAPVPVVLSLASWSERALTLEEWVTEEIRLRYFLPRQSARGWLDGGRLMLLLDGLDEAGAARRSDCIAAINRFRRSLPLVALAVTCREEDYAGSVKAGDVLGLDGAIGLLPLSPSQVALALAPHADREELERLVTSPLLLGVARRILTSDESPSPSAGEIDRDSLQDRLFQRLVHDCLRSEERDGYGEDEAVRWLSHLARTMLHRNRTVLAVEELQPSWLVSAWSRAAYVLLSRVLAGLWIGIAAACFLGLLSHSAALARNVVADGVAGGIGVALLDGALLPRKRPVAPARKGRLTSDSLYAALAGSAAGAGVLTLHLARDAGGLFAATVFHGLLFALIFARPLRAVRFDRDVAAVETLLWSWTAALRSWAAVGLFTWSLLLLGRFSGLWPARVGAGSALLSTLPNAFFFASVPALLLGLEPGFVEGKTRPNHGIWLSARNAVLTGGLSLAGCLVSVLAGWLLARFGLIGSVQFLRNAEMRPGLLLFIAVSGFFAPLAALRFGGLDIIKHAALRLLLWRQGLCPLLFPRFLEHATRRGLLRRAGGGYLFFHSTLMAYLANMSAD